MATLADKDKLLEIIAEVPDGIELNELAKRLSKSQPITSTLLSRLAQDGMVTNPERGVWRATEAGQQKLGIGKEPARVAVEEPGSVMKSAEATEPSEAKVPDAYDKFIAICRSCGIKDDFSKSVTDHIFLGDVYNLNDVWDSLQGMYLRPDVTKRIFNFWSRVINQPVPAELVSHVMPSKTEAGKEAELKAPTRFTIIGDEILADPEGEFTFSQARQVMMTKVIQAAAPGVGGDSIASILGALAPFMETQRTAKAEDAAKQGEQSVLAAVVTKLIEDRGGGGQQPMTLTDMLSIVDKIDEARKNAVAAVAAGAGKQASGFEELERMVTVFDKMKGLFGSKGEGNSGVTIAVRGENGETGAIPLDTFFKLEDHKRKTRQEDEELDNKRETGKSVRKFFESISKAATNLSSRG